jgi:hypothetical protein
MSTIDGPALLGFSDFFSGEVVGAAKKSAAKPAAAPKKGTGSRPARPYPQPTRTAVVAKHGKVLKQGHAVATKAAKAIGVAMHLLGRKPVATKLSGKTVHVGADVAAKMSPKAKLAVQKHNDAVAKAKKAGQVLAQHAVKTRNAVKTLAQKMVAQKKTSKLLRTPLKKRAVHVGELLADPVIGEQVAQMLGEYYESVGAAPDPANPGYLDDGSPDPAAGPATAPSDADLGIPDAAGDAVDSGVELPAPPPMSQFIADMAAAGGIVYDGSKGTPDGFCGSYNLFTRATDDYHEPGARGTIDGDAHYGYVFGSFDQDKHANGIPWGGDMPSATWNHVHGRHKIFEGDFWNAASLAEAAGSYSKMSPNGKVMYGPLVGNPEMPDFKAMRVDGQGNMFWLPQEAPDWLTFPLKQAAALTAQATAKAEAEAAKAAAAAETKARADEAAAKAAQDAANALAESQAASTQKIAKGEEEVKQQAAETEAQQALVKQQAEDTTAQAVETAQTKEAGTLLLEQARQQAAQDKQVSDLLVEQAKQEQAYYAAHPDVLPGSGVPGADEDQGSDEAMDDSDSMDDGEQIPGADVMRDEDGEGYQGDEG